MLGQNVILLVLMIGIFYFLLIRPTQKREREKREMLSSLKKGDLVVTSGGVLGKIATLTDQVATLEVGDKVRVRVLRSHIAGRQAAEVAATQASE